MVILYAMRRLGIMFGLMHSLTATAQPLIFNMSRGVTPISHDIYDLHMTIFWICVVIGIIVFGLLIYSLVKHRKSLGHKPATFSHNRTVEIIWVIIPSLILIAMATPATIVLINMNDDAKSDINIKVTGFQWKWQYEYLDLGIQFFSNLSTPQTEIQGQQPKNSWYLLQVDKPLVVPIHKKIRFLVTSNDVIHSWWVPALGVKRDAIPGFIHEAWARIDKPGIYRGQCAELCGMNHAFMPIVVDARTQEDFDTWVSEQTGAATTSTTPLQPQSLATLLQIGKEVYDKTCAVCHKPEGTGQPPVFPALVGSKITTGPLPEHINIVLNGKTGTAMQAFKNQLSNQELAAVITYERNSWGNDNTTQYGKNAGGMVQASDILKSKG